MHKKYSYAFGAGIALFFFTIVLINITQGSFLKTLDQSIDTRLLSIQDPLLVSYAVWIGYATNMQHIYLAAVCLIGFLIYRNKRRTALLSGFFLLINTLSFSFLKAQTAIPRPAEILTSETTFAFPSGHTATAFFFFGLVWYVFYTHLKHPLKRILLLCSALIPFIVGAARMYSHSHWFSDVLSGSLHGLFWLCSLLFLVSLTKKG